MNNGKPEQKQNVGNYSLVAAQGRTKQTPQPAFTAALPSKEQFLFY